MQPGQPIFHSHERPSRSRSPARRGNREPNPTDQIQVVKANGRTHSAGILTQALSKITPNVSHVALNVLLPLAGLGATLAVHHYLLPPQFIPTGTLQNVCPPYGDLDWSKCEYNPDYPQKMMFVVVIVSMLFALRGLFRAIK